MEGDENLETLSTSIEQRRGSATYRAFVRLHVEAPRDPLRALREKDTRPMPRFDVPADP